MIVAVSEHVDAEEQCGQMLVNAVTLMRAIARVRTNGDDRHECACILCETEEIMFMIMAFVQLIRAGMCDVHPTWRPRENNPLYHSHCRRVNSGFNSVM